MHIYILYNIPLINPIQLPIHSHIKVVSTGCSASGREEDQGNVRVIPREIRFAWGVKQMQLDNPQEDKIQ